MLKVSDIAKTLENMTVYSDRSGQVNTQVSNLSSLTKKWLGRKKKLDKESCHPDADSGYCTARRCEAAIYEKCIAELKKIIKDC